MKKRIKNTLILLGIVICANQSFAQNQKIVDSLQKVLNSAKEDTTRLQIYLAICDNCKLEDNLKYGEPAVELADKLLSQTNDTKRRQTILKHKASALIVIGIFYGKTKIHDVKKGLEYLDKSLHIFEDVGDTQATVNSLENIANMTLDQGLLSNALDYNLKALALSQEIGYKQGICNDLGEIGEIYGRQGNHSKAIEYGLKALAVAQKIGDKDIIAFSLYNLAGFYDNSGDYTNAEEYGAKALAIVQEKKDTSGIAELVKTIGNIYINQGNYSKGMEYFQKNLALCTKMGLKNGIAYSYSRIAKIDNLQGANSDALLYYLKSLNVFEETGTKPRVNDIFVLIGKLYTIPFKNYKLAKVYLDSAVNGAKSISDIGTAENAYSGLVKIDSITNNYKAEIEDYKNYIFYRDSLRKMSNSQRTIQMEMGYEFDQLQATSKAEQAQKDIQVEADKRKQTIIIWSIIGGLLLVLIFSGFIFRSLRVTRKQKQVIEIKSKETEEQKNLIEKQKELVEEKNKDILDSITYAKRLQDAILPPLSIIKQYLPESFLLYKPKDIVAGDFYWLERAGDNILIAAADCTGHGVPGALVSVVCSNALNRTVKEFNITEPGKILDKVRELVLETFEKGESNVQDGMDISLCCINTKTNEMQWSGAYNSLWYIQNGQIHEVAADKQPIGKSDRPRPFNTHNLNLQKGDTLYLFTDGYADQFGGLKGKKFKYKQMEELLLANAAKPMNEQKNILENTLHDWKGNLEQVDDILIIGIRV